jgi:hypothetical protein
MRPVRLSASKDGGQHMRELSQYHRSGAPNINSWIALENSGVYEIGKCCNTACVCVHNT